MAEFQELIKNFDRIRDYMRQFYIYGFKVRNDFDGKSARTYDNEKRRIESWLSDFMKADFSSKGKHVYINVDSKAVAQNPLYAAWKSKSFTDNDLLLHFFVLDVLWERTEGLTAGGLCDVISEVYEMVFDNQTMRLKLKEYERLGILVSEKSGKNLLYRICPPSLAEHQKDGCDNGKGECLWDKMITAVKFFQEAAPFGFIGSTILDREQAANDLFQFKHHFIVHTLEDGILLNILQAIREHREIEFENKSRRNCQVSIISGIPLRIFVSTQTGRRYLCLYLPKNRRFNTARLDSITKVLLKEVREDYSQIMKWLSKAEGSCWGVSFGNRGSRLEEVCLKLYINEKTESHILNRLYREGRGGEILRIQENEFLYSGFFFDTNEMLSWIKTFTGRVLDIQGTNQFAVSKVAYDWEKMYRMYCSDEAASQNSNTVCK